MSLTSKGLDILVRLRDARKFQGDARATAKSVDKIGDASKRSATKMKAASAMSSAASKGFVAMGKAAKYGGLLLAGAMAVGLKKSVDAHLEAQVVTAQTEAIIKKMGDRSQLTAKQIDELASATALKTGLDDEAVKSAQNMLLTIGNVNVATKEGAEVFGDSTELLGDMAAVMGGDVSGAGTLLAKAMSDPVNSMTRLGKRMGLTKKEMDRMKVAMEDANTPAEQQAVLVDALSDKLGGLGEAAGGTTQGSINRMKVVLGDLGEVIGAKLAPYIEDAADWMVDFVTEMQNGTGTGGEFVDIMRDTADVLKRVGGFLKSAWKHTKAFAKWTQEGSAGADALEWSVYVLGSGLVLFAGASVVGKAKAAYTALTTSQWLLNIAMYANPIGLVIGLIALLVGSLIWLYFNNENFRKGVNLLWDTTKLFFTDFDAGWKQAKEIMSAQIDYMLEKINQLSNALNPFGGTDWSESGEYEIPDGSSSDSKWNPASYYDGVFPGFASGGSISARPGATWVTGEAGPELSTISGGRVIVQPLSAPSVSSLDTARLRGDDGDDRPIQLVVDGRVLAEVSAQHYKRRLARR